VCWALVTLVGVGFLGVSLKEVFVVPWEVDEPVSPPCRDIEVTSSGAKDN
jgi:hypothetical protein